MRIVSLVGLLLLLIAPAVHAQHRRSFIVAYTTPTIDDSHHPYEGFMVGAAFPLLGPVELATRAHYFRNFTDNKVALDVALQSGVRLRPFELTGFAGLSTWYPGYDDRVSDMAIRQTSTVVGAQVRFWIVRRVGVVWEGMRRGVLDDSPNRGGHLGVGLIARW